MPKMFIGFKKNDSHVLPYCIPPLEIELKLQILSAIEGALDGVSLYITVL